ncbi:aspartate aminotransferase family protein [Wenzhouxiangella sp. XN79A]|uniref:acetylornithine transaminase n=1 Tax=Wenzhouxiangella sp. XN79A TaxID=2724193 RepID=UPI00144A6687|nr:aspartate aminotransferase family protein [Wenzhouxiangella sp. XN79A]
MSDHLMKTYARLPVAFVRGEGAWLYDEDGTRYLDAISGIAVCSLGHADPVLADALCDQARTLIHTANLGHIRLQERLAERLCTITGMDRAFITNTGAEAIETVLKLARRFGFERGIEQPKILVVEGAFHGRTLGAISASAPGKLQHGFAPLVDGFVRVPYGDADAARAALAGDPSIVAMLLEPIQGEGGVKRPPDGYLTALRRACDEHRALLMVDEIQTGLCRTGRWYAHQHEPDCRPDVLASAKALGNGVPVAACLARGAAAEVLTPGSHGTTYGGNPLACRAALTVLDRMEALDLNARAETMGARLVERLRERLAGCERVVEIRGRGLMIGVELADPAGDVRDHALKQHVLINVTHERVIRLLPPLIIDADQARTIADAVADGVLGR